MPDLMCWDGLALVDIGAGRFAMQDRLVAGQIRLTFEVRHRPLGRGWFSRLHEGKTITYWVTVKDGEPAHIWRSGSGHDVLFCDIDAIRERLPLVLAALRAGSLLKEDDGG